MRDKYRTKKHFADQLKKLSQSIPLAKITVSKLCEFCQVNRGTFYYHFHDIYELINWTYHADVTETVVAHIKVQTTQIERASQLGVQNVYNSRGFYIQAIRLSGQNNLRDYILSDVEYSWDYLVVRFLDDRKVKYSQLNPEQQEKLEYAKLYYCSANHAVFLRWIESGMTSTPQFIAYLLDTTLQNGLSLLLDDILNI